MDTPDWIPFVGGPSRPAEPFLERAADWAAALSYGDIPHPVRRAGRAQLTSGVGAALRTGTHPIGDRIRGAIESSGGAATVLGGGRAAPATAAVSNGVLASALEFDASVLGGRTDASCVFVPLAYAEATGADGEELLVAQVAANEITARLGAAVTTGPFAGPDAAWIHAAGAATGRAVIEDDSPETLADALATALSEPPRPIERSALGADAGVWRPEAPIRTGLAAVESARSGIEGRTDLIEGDEGLLSGLCRRPAWGYLSGFGERWHTAALSVRPVPGSAYVGDEGLLSGLCRRPAWGYLSGLGERWHTAALSVRPVPGSAYVAAATEATLEARGRFDRGRTTIRAVEVYGPHALYSMDAVANRYLDDGRAPIAAAVRSARRATAEALVHGEITPQRIGARGGRGAIPRVVDRVDIDHEPALTIAALRSSVPEGIEFDGMGRAVAPGVARAVGARATLRHPPTVVGTGRRLAAVPDPSEIERRIGARVVVRTADGRAVEGSLERPSGVAGAPPAEIRAVARRKCRESLGALGVSESVARTRTDRLSRIDEEPAVRLGWLFEGSASRRAGGDGNT